ncbi:hypothetical protein MAM1_1186d11500 [Mucor ambiguus]|uniref:Uncharacterized protein n=1 Tax=Mucor ambiguus TaxID=91626 RepID=A0A0C9MWX5_9FUNG|nr:hypothetical protein MAM1_1186d11500 [Mucor ambiguus]
MDVEQVSDVHLIRDPSPEIMTLANIVPFRPTTINPTAASNVCLTLNVPTGKRGTFPTAAGAGAGAAGATETQRDSSPPAEPMRTSSSSPDPTPATDPAPAPAPVPGSSRSRFSGVTRQQTANLERQQALFEMETPQ